MMWAVWIETLVSYTAQAVNVNTYSVAFSEAVHFPFRNVSFPSISLAHDCIPQLISFL